MNNEVQVIPWYEAVRRRPAMYIGGADEWHLLWLLGELKSFAENLLQDKTAHLIPYFPPTDRRRNAP